jgi:hypothetical protein
MKRTSVSIGWLISMFLITLPVHAGQVTVDCDAGESIEEAIHQEFIRSRGIEGIVVDVLGTCVDNVRVQVNRVTLRGGILESPVNEEGEPVGNALTMMNSQEFRLDGVTIRRSRTGLMAENSLGTVDDCRIEENIYGAMLHDSNVLFRQTRLAGNAYTAVWAQLGSAVGLYEAEIVDNGRWGVVVGWNSGGTIDDSTITGSDYGAMAVYESGIDIDDTTVQDIAYTALVLYMNSSAFLRDSTFTSASFTVDVEADSIVQSLGELEVNGSILLWGHGRIDLSRATIAGDVIAMRFSDVALDFSTASGWLYCADASDAIGSGTSVAGVSGCPNWTAYGSDTEDRVLDGGIEPLHIGADLEPIRISP